MLAIVQYDLLDPPGLAQTLQAEEEEDISLMRVAELPQQDCHKAMRKKAWRTEVPWLAQLLPSDLPGFVTYVALLRQPRHKCFIGYYKVDGRRVHVPTEFKEQSRQHKFDSAAGEHHAAQAALEWVWAKHLAFVPAEMPEKVEHFISPCAACESGSCQVLTSLQVEWEKTSGRSSSSSGSSSSSDSSSCSTDSSTENDPA